MISFKNEFIFIRELSYLALQVLFHDWWASIDLSSKHPIAWNNSWYAPLWCFYLHCGIEKTSIPDTIFIICHQVLQHQSKHGTSSMGKQVLAKACIAKLNEITESEVTKVTTSTVDETALAILKRQWSRRITIVCSQRKFVFNIKILSILTELPDRMVQSGI